MILITEPMDETWVDWLRNRSDVDYQPDLSDFPEELGERAQLAQALIVGNRTAVTGDLLYAGFSCVGVMGAGLGNIDATGCAARDITVLEATGMELYGLADRVIDKAADLSGGAGALRGKTLGLIGYGDIAQAVARRGAEWGMTCLASDPEAEEFPGAMEGTSEEVLTTADILVIDVPTNDETRGMIDAAVISTLRLGTVVINTADNSVIDMNALRAALGSGRLGGAALRAADGGTELSNLGLIDVREDGATQARLSEATARNVAAHLGIDG